MKDFKLDALNLVQNIKTESDLKALQSALYQNGFGYSDSTSHEFKLRTIINVANKLNLTLPLNFTKQYWKLSAGSYILFEKLIEKYFNQFDKTTRITHLLKELLVVEFYQYHNPKEFEVKIAEKIKQGYMITVNKQDNMYLNVVNIQHGVKLKAKHNTSKLEELYKLVLGEIDFALPYFGDSITPVKGSHYQVFKNGTIIFNYKKFTQEVAPIIKNIVLGYPHDTAFKSKI